MNSFSRRVRFGQSTSPFRRGFTLEEWQSSFEECDEPAVHDKNLYESGEHFHQRLTTLWELYDQLGLSEIDPVRLRRGIVAAINREHVVLANRLREEMLRNAQDGIIRIEETAGTRIKIDHTAAEYNIEDLVGSMVDGALLPLRKCFEMSHNQRKKPELHQIRGISLLGQLHFVLLLNWENCSWRGYVAKENGSIVTFQPTNEQEARHNAIALSRYYARISETFMHLLNGWNALPELVKSRLSGTRFKVKISGAGRSIRFLPEIDGSNLGGPPQSAILRMTGTEMYFLSILEMELPRCGGITLNELLSIWEIIYSLAQELRGLLPSNTGPQNLNELEKFAPLLPKGALASLLAECTNLRYGTCVKVLDFLTFSKKNPDELWARPFVQHDEMFLTPVINCITSANPTRMIEQWMKLGGIDLVARGTEFERHCRSEAADSIGSNKLLINSGVLAAPRRFKEVKDNPGDIDIVLWIGNSIIVGEIKCNLFPSKPSEKTRHLEEMASAVKQIQRKAAALRKTAVEFYLSLTGKAPTAELKVIPFVLTNLTFGAGIQFEEVPVVDLLILSKYLRDGSMEKFRLVDNKSDESGGYRIYFYDSEAEAEQRVEIYLNDPPQLWHFHDSIVPQENPIEPLKVGDVRWIARDYQVAIDSQALLKKDLEGMSNSRFNYRLTQL